MTTGPRPMCMGCRHYHDRNDEGLTCDAFPNGIPAPIYMSEHDHRRPFKGDRGIRFDPVTLEAAAWADRLFPRGGDAGE